MGHDTRVVVDIDGASAFIRACGKESNFTVQATSYDIGLENTAMPYYFVNHLPTQ